MKSVNYWNKNHNFSQKFLLHLFWIRIMYQTSYLMYHSSPLTTDTSGSLNYKVIGQIIDKPAEVSKAIKQELIDDAALAVVERHSSQCTLTRFIQEKQSNCGLRIEDVRSLLVADDASRVKVTSESTPLPVVTDTSAPEHADASASIPVTMEAAETTEDSATPLPLSVETGDSVIPHVTSITSPLLSSEVITSQPLHMVTTETNTKTLTEKPQPLHMVTTVPSDTAHAETPVPMVKPTRGITPIPEAPVLPLPGTTRTNSMKCSIRNRMKLCLYRTVKSLHVDVLWTWISWMLWVYLTYNLI